MRIRIAAVADIHLGADARGTLRPRLADVAEHADVLLLAGDLTRYGTVAEADVAAAELGGLGVPVVAVLGNHDYQDDRQEEMAERLQRAGVTVLTGQATVIDTPRGRVGIAGEKGFGGGFAGRGATEFGEPEMRALVRRSRESACRLGRMLATLPAGPRIALTHYAPITETLRGEPREIYPFLGSSLLADAIDGARATLALHGHAHSGSPSGSTPGGVPVHNVAMPVLGRPYTVLSLGD